MTLRSKNDLVRSLLWLFFPLLLACSSSPRLYLQYGDQFIQSNLERLLAQNPLAPGENFKVVTLGKSREVSHHVVQIRDREAPHIHKDHDVTVVLLKGQGYLVFERRRVDLASGDVLFIPRAAVHYFVNTHSQPSVALAVFSPPFDGKDTIHVKE